jgi:hypothetical protein
MTYVAADAAAAATASAAAAADFAAAATAAAAAAAPKYNHSEAQSDNTRNMDLGSAWILTRPPSTKLAGAPNPFGPSNVRLFLCLCI